MGRRVVDRSPGSAALRGERESRATEDGLRVRESCPAGIRRATVRHGYARMRELVSVAARLRMASAARDGGGP